MLTATVIRRFGLKATPQRLAVYEVLHGRNDHPSVEQVFDAVRERHPTISLNTVYRTLESLEAAGAVRRLRTGDNAARYDARMSPHAHLLCRGCGVVCDLFGPFAEGLPESARAAGGQTGYAIDAAELYFVGRCPDCQEQP